MPKRHPWMALCLLLLMALSVGACETQDYGPVTTMQAMPESHLVPFPGATLLSQGGFPRKSSPEEGTAAAYLDREFGANGTESAVIDYYSALLKPLGWTEGCSVCSDWTKPGYGFAINVRNPGSLPSAARGYELVYDEILSENTDHTPARASGT